MDNHQDNQGTVERLLDRFPSLSRIGAGVGKRKRRIPYVQQTAATDCGAACLTMVMDYFGKKVRLDEVRQIAGVSRDGADALSILRAGRWFGLRGRGVQIDDIEALKFLEPGAILHWEFRHFVVFESLSKKGAIIVDPASGRRDVPREELRSSFTGVALSLEPTDEFEPGGTKSHGVGRYLRQVLGQSGLLSKVLVISVLLQLLALALPIVTGLLVDRVVPRGDYDLLTILSVGLAGIVIFNFLSSLIRAHLLLHLRTHLDAKITLEFLDHLVDLPYAFFQQRSAGDLMMRLNSNATIREILTSGALSGFLDGALVTIYLVLLFVTHFKIGLLVLFLGVLRILIFLITRRRHKDLMSESLAVQATSRNYQVQLFAGIETLKAMGAEQRAVEQWSNLFVDELNVPAPRGRLNAVFDSLLGALATGSPLVIMAYGGLEVLNGNLSLGTMLAMNALAAGFLTPLSTLVSTAVQFQLLGSYMERINDVLETPKEQERSEVTPAPKLSGRICLEKVSFQYSPVAPLVVQDVSVNIESGRFVALVGTSGAGKTTLANLLLGLYRPTTGRILFDEVDLEGLDLRTVRGQLGIVPQQPYVFGGSIRQNLSLADPTRPLADLVEAARLAAVHDDIMAMPMGYHTLIGDMGASLSGGQRQRLALARALVHKPSILLLDEATSSLDAVTERTIQDNLQALRCTRIVIAHRLSTIMAADLILVMDGGQIVEQGTHDELMEHHERYAQLVEAQMQKEGDSQA